MIYIGDEYSDKDILKVIFDKEIKQSIAHELKHMFDNYYIKKRDIYQHELYNSITNNLKDFPKLINDFLYLLYYVSVDEKLVKASELQQKIIDKNITKSEFENFFNNNKMIKLLSKAEKFNLKKFKNILDHNPDVNDILIVVKKDGYKSIGSNSDDILNILYITIINDIGRNINITLNNLKKRYQQLYNHNSLFNINKIEYKIMKELSKYKNEPSKYFEYIEKYLNHEGKIQKKKLSKLFDIALDDNKMKNWNLHNKINSKKKKYENI